MNVIFLVKVAIRTHQSVYLLFPELLVLLDHSYLFVVLNLFLERSLFVLHDGFGVLLLYRREVFFIDLLNLVVVDTLLLDVFLFLPDVLGVVLIIDSSDHHHESYDHEHEESQFIEVVVILVDIDFVLVVSHFFFCPDSTQFGTVSGVAEESAIVAELATVGPILVLTQLPQEFLILLF